MCANAQLEQCNGQIASTAIHFQSLWFWGKRHERWSSIGRKDRAAPDSTTTSPGFRCILKLITLASRVNTICVRWRSDKLHNSGVGDSMNRYPLLQREYTWDTSGATLGERSAAKCDTERWRTVRWTVTRREGGAVQRAVCSARRAYLRAKRLTDHICVMERAELLGVVRRVKLRCCTAAQGRRTLLSNLSPALAYT